jgi:putative CocE/NonD family hydrolase
MIEERDISVAMRDGTRLAVDVYRPDKPGSYPVLYAAALHNKDLQGPDIADILPPQPAHAPLWFGPIEAGDTRRFIANGYVHVIAQPRGSAKSEGHYGHEDTDHYDLIEWITKQPWSNGKVGMVGISGYAGEQWRAAAQGHPALKAIFPYDACSAYGGMFGFRDFNPGGCCTRSPICSMSSARSMSPATVQPSCPPQRKSSGAAPCRTRTSSNTSISTTFSPRKVSAPSSCIS